MIIKHTLLRLHHPYRSLRLILENTSKLFDLLPLAIRCSQRSRLHGIIPAHAELTHLRLSTSQATRDHPRACGAHGKLSTIRKEHPEMTIDVFKQMPRALTDPIMIVDSMTTAGRIVVALELKDKSGINVVVPFELDTMKGLTRANIITSAYGKEIDGAINYDWYLKNIRENKLRYVNRKKANILLGSAGVQFSLDPKANGFLDSSIKTEEDLVKLKNENPTLYQTTGYNQEKNRGTKGYITPYSDGRRMITLLEEADESTFLHEMSHMFLMGLEDLAQIDEVSKKELELVDAWANWEKGAAKEYRGTPWEREFRNREQGIIDAETAGDHDTADRLKRQWRQERFARAFELYLREGKAPARGLRAVFRKFKQFLRVIYQAFAGDGGRASLPVQRVMARMIATEDEIEEMSLDDRYKDVTKAGGEKLLDEDDAKTYARWREESIAEAKEKLMKTVMKDLAEKKEREGSSPRMRGSRGRPRGCVPVPGIIPAHAGLTLCPRQSLLPYRDHPRACGAHSVERSA